MSGPGLKKQFECGSYFSVSRLSTSALRVKGRQLLIRLHTNEPLFAFYARLSSAVPAFSYAVRHTMSASQSQCEPAGQWTLGLIPRHSPPGCPSCADAKTKELKTQTPIATKPSPIHRSRQELALLAFCIGSLLDFPSGATNAIYARSYCCCTANCSLRKGAVCALRSPSSSARLQTSQSLQGLFSFP